MRYYRDGQIFELDLSTMDKMQLLDLKAKIDKERGEIEGQLSAARRQYALTGTYSDPVWYRNAESALRIKGKQSQDVQNQLARLKFGRGKGIAEIFVDLARANLDRDCFANLIKEAEEIYGAQTKSQGDERGNLGRS